MKKTFSLKLMLLGLLIGFGSMTTYAAKFFVNGAFVYEKFGGGVKVVGVTGLPNNKTLTIVSKVVDTADPNLAEYDVVAIADNWYNPGTLIWEQEGQQSPITQPTANLLGGDKFNLVIDANKLGAISTKALQPLSQNEKLLTFKVTSNAILGGIPEYAFVVAKKTKEVEVCPDETQQPYKGYREMLDKLLDNKDVQIDDVQFCGGKLKEDDNKQVYTTTFKGEKLYFVIGGKSSTFTYNDKDWYEAYSAADIYKWIKAGRPTSPKLSPIGYVRTEPRYMNFRVDEVAEDYSPYQAVEAEEDECITIIPGLATQAQEAKEAYENLKRLLNNAKLSDEWTDLLDKLTAATNAYNKWKVYSDKVDAVRPYWNVPYIVTAAVEAGTKVGTFPTSGVIGASERELRPEEKTQFDEIMEAMLEGEFTNVTEKVLNEGAEQLQSCDYDLYELTADGTDLISLAANYPEDFDGIVAVQSNQLGFITEETVDGNTECRFTAFEMTAGTLGEATDVPVKADYDEDWYELQGTYQDLDGVDQDFFENEIDIDETRTGQFVVSGMGVFYSDEWYYTEDDYDDGAEYATYLSYEGYLYKYTGSSEIVGGVEYPVYEAVTKTLTTEGTPATYLTVVKNDKNELITNDEDASVLATAAYDEEDYTEQATNGYYKPSFENVKTILAAALIDKETAQKNVDDHKAYCEDVENEDGETEEVCYNPFKLEAAGGPVDKAKQKMDELADALEAAEWAQDPDNAGLQAQLESALACHTEYELNFNDLDVNNTLTSIDIESAPNMTTIGKFAAAMCEKAALGGETAKLPANLTTIGERAFYDAKLANPDFTTLTKLWRIGDYAFAQSGATDGDFHDAANLGIEDPDPTKAGYFGTNVFDDCAIVNLMLKGTPLKAIPGNLAQGLKRVEAPFMDACGKFWNFDNDKNKLTDHALTADEIAVLKPYLWKDKTATELEALVGTKLNDEQVSIITTAGLVMETKRPVNISLIEASLPEAITVIEAATEPNPVVADKVYGTYENCINLATLTGGIPAGVTTIGYKAFYATKIDEFNLSALDKLSTIGKYAFGGNSELTKVTLPEASAWDEEGLTELPEGVFECDSELEELILNPELTCLPKGLLKGSKIKKLDLSNSQIEVLPDLFQATPDDPNTTLVEVILPEEKIADDGVTVEIPGLKVIMDNAFANMHALKGKKQEDGSYRFEIPSTVWIMRPGVFFNDIALEEVYAMDSRLTNLGVNTFKGCASLKKFTFVTLEAINSTWTMYPRVRYNNIPCEEIIPFSAAQFNFDDMQFFGCPYGDPQTEGKDKRPIVVMTQESYDQIKAEYWNHPSYDKLYSRIEIYQPTIALTKIGGKYYGTYYNANYGTWVPMSEGKVYTAYQDGGTIYAYSAKHNNGYYKIPAAGESTFIYDTEARYAQGSAAVLIVSDHENVKVERHSTMYKKDHTTLDIENELRVTANNGRTGYPIATTTADFIYKFSFDAEGPGFFHWVTKPDNKVVPVGKVVFPMSDYQGTANPNVFGGLTGGEMHAPVEPGWRPARLNIVFVDDETSTGIKDYIKSHNLNDGAIYNLQGVRVKNTVKGQMYIQNGQKFIQK